MIGATLDAIRRQARSDHEIIVIDSGSTDETRVIARASGARVIAIRAADFSYGRALNLAIDRTRAPLIVSLSAHATPVSRDWLEHLGAPFADPRVGAVYGRHVPRSNATRLELLGMRLSGTLGTKRRYHTRGIGFSNANGAFRRALWEIQPFDEIVPGAEDVVWARAIHRRGYAVVFEPAAAVYHSHGESIARLLRRICQDQPVILRAWLGRMETDGRRSRDVEVREETVIY